MAFLLFTRNEESLLLEFQCSIYSLFTEDVFCRLEHLWFHQWSGIGILSWLSHFLIHCSQKMHLMSLQGFRISSRFLLTERLEFYLFYSYIHILNVYQIKTLSSKRQIDWEIMYEGLLFPVNSRFQDERRYKFLYALQARSKCIWQNVQVCSLHTA